PNAPKLVASSSPRRQKKNIGIAIEVHVLRTEPIGASGRSFHVTEFAILQTLHRLLGISAENLHLVNSGVRVPVLVCFSGLGNDLERELREVGCDFEFEVRALRQVFGRGLRMSDLLRSDIWIVDGFV